jgi:hypothetical protein
MTRYATYERLYAVLRRCPGQVYIPARPFLLIPPSGESALPVVRIYLDGCHFVTLSFSATQNYQLHLFSIAQGVALLDELEASQHSASSEAGLRMGA